MRDPSTGAVYHLQYDPPNAADAPLVNGRLERVTDPTHEEAQMVRPQQPFAAALFIVLQ